MLVGYRLGYSSVFLNKKTSIAFFNMLYTTFLLFFRINILISYKFFMKILIIIL